MILMHRHIDVTFYQNYLYTCVKVYMYLFKTAWTSRPFLSQEDPAVPEADATDISASEVSD